MRFRTLIVCLLFVAVCAAPLSAASPSDAPPLPRSGLGDEPIRSSTASQGSAAQEIAVPQSQGMEYGRVLGALGLVIALIFVLRWCGRWAFPSAGRRGGSQGIEVISRAPLSPKQQVILLRVGRRLVVVGDSGSQMNPLCEITDADEIAALVGQLQEQGAVAPGRVFGSIFGRSRKDYDGGAESPPPEAATPLTDIEPEETGVTSAREELNGLRERVRIIAAQFNG